MKSYIENAAGSTFMISIRDAFISLLPFLIILSIFTLASSLLGILNVLPELQNILLEIAISLNVCFSPLAAIAVGFQLSKNINISVMPVLAVGVTAVVIVVLLSMDDPSKLNVADVIKDPRLILSMLINAYLLKYLDDRINVIFIRSTSISQHLKRHVHLLFPSLLSVLILPVLLFAISFLSQAIMTPVVHFMADSEVLGLLSFKIFLSNLFWTVGLHGSNTFHLLIEQSTTGTINFHDVLITANLSLNQFSDLLVNFGGGGATWSLIIAILLFSKDSHIRRIALIAIPFAIFNINEILIFAIPIAFNLRLALPFLLVPLINCFIGYFVVTQQWFSFIDYQHSWVLPDGLNIYLATGGSWLAVLTQLSLIGLGVFLYKPFVLTTTTEERLQQVEQSLHNKLALQDDIELISERTLVKKRQQQRRSIKATLSAVRDVNEGELLLYYQPKIELDSTNVQGLEALLRLKRKDGKVVGPYFLDDLQNEGFSLPIDLWVVKEVSRTIKRWRIDGYMPKVSINLDPNNLLREGFVKNLIMQLGDVGEQIEIELLESRYMENSQEIEQVLRKLITFGFTVSIDDFGTGFSCLSMLTKISAQTIKIDKSMLDEAAENKGAKLYQEICRLCQTLEFEIVAEGVETKEQLDFVKQAGIKLIQGWYYSPALPANEIAAYNPKKDAN